MKKNCKNCIYFGLGILIAVGSIALIYFRRKKEFDEAINEKDKSLDSNIKNPKETFTVGSEEQSSVELKKSEKLTHDKMVIGSKGRPVGLIQSWLNFKYGTNIDVDGRFGQQTRDELRDKLGWWCGSYGLGDKECTIKSSDKIVKDAILAMNTNKNFIDYLNKYYTKVIKEFEPINWGGVYFGDLKKIK